MALENLSGQLPDLALRRQVGEEQLNFASGCALPDLRCGRFTSLAIASNQQHHRAGSSEPECGLFPESRAGPRH